MHGEDFAILGKESDIDWVKSNVQLKMNIKVKARLRRGEEGSVRILNRVVAVARDGLEYEADQRHAEIIMRDLWLGIGSKSVVTPGTSTVEGGMFRRRSKERAEQWRRGGTTSPRIGLTSSSQPRR